MAGYIFLSPNWSKDEQLLSNGLRYYNKSCYPLQLLLFPEGTDLSDHNKAKSQQFATANQLQVYDHVLHPRTRGFIKCIEEMTKGGYLQSIVDITVAYNGNIPQTFLQNYLCTRRANGCERIYYKSFPQNIP